MKWSDAQIKAVESEAYEMVKGCDFRDLPQEMIKALACLVLAARAKHDKKE